VPCNRHSSLQGNTLKIKLSQRKHPRFKDLSYEEELSFIGAREMVHMESFHKMLQVRSGLMWRRKSEHGNNKKVQCN
jgi:hypothetical protein